MTGQLPPTDPTLRRHLVRRSSGRLPENLLVETFARLDASTAPVRRVAPSPMRPPRPVWAVAGLAAAALLAVAVALPFFRPAPASYVAGYPGERPLTTAELAQLMAGPDLAGNETVVARVVIKSRSDVCPMNRYPTIGLVEGTDTQICVMAGSLSAVSTRPLLDGVFAFRYIAPGYLGLLAEITPASSRLAFGVAEDWPLDGSAFLVEGYLGSTDVPCAEETPAPGDVLDPSGYEQCRWSWLSDDGSPAAVQSLPTWSPAANPSEPAPAPSLDLLGLDGKARHVEAGGARVIDSIPDTTTYGLYVVRPVTGPCPGAAPYDSRGCAVWRILAKVPEVSLSDRPSPSATASPTPAAQVGPDGLLGPGNEPLTLTEVVDLMQTDPGHLAGWTVVLDAPFGSGVACPDGGTCAALKDLLESQGTWAVRIGSDGLFGIVGEVQRDPGGALLTSLEAAVPDGRMIVVDAWLHGETTQPCAIPDSAPGPDCTPVEIAYLSATESSNPDEQVPVQIGAYRAFFGSYEGATASAHGIFLVQFNSGRQDMLMSRFAASGWAPGPSASLPATPQPEPSTSPLSVTGPALNGLIGDGGRPLTQAELSSAWAADSAHLAGRVAIVKGPFAERLVCWGQRTSPLAPPETCVPGPVGEEIAPEGYWAVRVGGDGMLEVLGEIEMNGSLFVWSVDQTLANKTLKPDDLLIVQGQLGPFYFDLCDVVGQGCPLALYDATPTYDAPRLGIWLGEAEKSPTLEPDGLIWDGYRVEPSIASFFLAQRGVGRATILAIFNPLVLVGQEG